MSDLSLARVWFLPNRRYLEQSPWQIRSPQGLQYKCLGNRVQHFSVTWTLSVHSTPLAIPNRIVQQPYLTFRKKDVE
jgi:hypothetical protein